MTDTIDNILSDLTDLTLTAANAGVIKAAITRAKERLAALAQGPKEEGPAPTSWPTREEVIYRVLRYYKLTNLIDDEGEPYPLVDAVSNPAPATIASGEEQLRFLADEVAAALFPAQPPSLTFSDEKAPTPQGEGRGE